jgi:hypothetical protein
VLTKACRVIGATRMYRSLLDFTHDATYVADSTGWWESMLTRDQIESGAVVGEDALEREQHRDSDGAGGGELFDRADICVVDSRIHHVGRGCLA